MPNTEIVKPARATVKAAKPEKTKAPALTAMSAIITDKDKLTAFASRAIAAYSSSGPMIHTAFVSALWHTAQHGNPAILQRIYNALRPNDQNAVRLYLRRVSAIVGLEGEDPDGQATEVVQGAIAAGKMLDIKQGSFVVIQGHTTKIAKEWAKLCVERLVKPDGETDKMLLDRNSFAEVRTLADTDILKRIVAAATNIESSGNRKVTVSDATKKLLGKIVDLVEPRLNQLNLN